MSSSANSNTKRCGYLEWEDFFMGVSLLSAQKSKAPNLQVGACIVNPEQKIVGYGFNDMPIGCGDDKLPWGSELKEGETIFDKRHPYVCHAEMNAIVNKSSADMKGSTIYITLFPCNECAKLIIQSGIKEVVYLTEMYPEKEWFMASRRMLDLAKIPYRKYIPKKESITINFSAD